MSLLHTVVAFIVALGVLIVVHEYGHYLVARLCGVKVLRFSVGFGRPLALWRRGADRTEWVIAAVPFGGYVKMRAGRIAYVNSAYERLTGYTAAELVGRTPALLKSGAHEADFYRRLWTALLAGEDFR